MLRPAERFAVKLHDPIGAARAEAGRRAAAACRPAWLLLPMALVLGLTAAWLAQLGRPAVETSRMAGEPSTPGRPAEIEPALGGDSAAGWLGDVLPASLLGTRPAGRDAGWPVVLHRAGDGAFYADILVAGAALHARIDPTGAEARLAAADLPAGAVVEDERWLAAAVELQHLRLPEVAFRIVDAPTEAVLGMAGLKAAVEVEESPDRLRLVPTRRRR
ncbi:MAG: hypothetical protein H6852_02525 [Geminicoccaceae bacterium]|jgi:hypothetical protein|nr:hypothetical protein [Geminicoccaceae bacterium]MCB9966498.1 hypothetical protein [Geminicoccaceae bacterium]HRY24998.1 hypothetical protein [Geminicoccaceae bacterium]